MKEDTSIRHDFMKTKSGGIDYQFYEDRARAFRSKALLKLWQRDSTDEKYSSFIPALISIRQLAAIFRRLAF